jgi:hypothetical protein
MTATELMAAIIKSRRFKDQDHQLIILAIRRASRTAKKNRARHGEK